MFHTSLILNLYFVNRVEIFAPLNKLPILPSCQKYDPVQVDKNLWTIPKIVFKEVRFRFFYRYEGTNISNKTVMLTGSAWISRDFITFLSIKFYKIVNMCWCSTFRIAVQWNKKFIRFCLECKEMIPCNQLKLQKVNLRNAVWFIMATMKRDSILGFYKHLKNLTI